MTNKNLRIFYQNFRSLRSHAKQASFKELIEINENPGLLCVSETWFLDQVKSAEEPLFHNYYLVTKASRPGCNEHTAGGGVAIFAKEGLKVLDYTNELEFCRTKHVQACKVRVAGITITCFYRAPGRKQGVDDEKLYEYIKNRPPNEYIVGDLNLRGIDWENMESDSEGNKFMENFMESGMSQLIHFETCITGNILDVLLTQQPDRVVNLECDPSRVGHTSDHFPIVWEIRTRKEKRKKQKPFWVDDFKRADFKKYKEELRKRAKAIAKLYGNHEALYGAIVAAIKEAWAIAVPKKKIDPNRSFFYSDKEIADLHRQLRRKRTAMKRSPHVRKLAVDAKRLSRRVCMLKEAKIKMEQDRSIQGCNTAKAIMAEIDKYDPAPRLNPGPLKVNGENIESEKDIADAICDQYVSQYTEVQPPDYTFKSKYKPKKMKNVKFRKKWVIREIKEMKRRVAAGADGITPSMLIEGVDELADHLCNLFTTCVKKGTIPDEMRKSIVTPLYKGGSRADPGQYRPISVTSNLLKICEKVISKAIMLHMEKNRLWADTQFAFREGSSVTSNLISHDLNINRIRSQNGKVTIVLVDAKKAYDKMSFRVLHEGMCHAGMPEMLRKWFMNVLMDRSFRVKVGAALSREAYPTSGCLQGSAASPYLFNLACNTAFKAVPRECRQYVKVLQFADDLKVTCDTRTPRGCEALEKTLRALEGWAIEHTIYFHGGKTKLLHLGKREGPAWNYVLDGTILKANDSARDLGVVYNTKENNHDHFVNLIRAIEWKTRMFRKAIHTRDIKTLTVAWNMLIASKITFGVQAWGRPSKLQLRRLCAVQKRFLRGAMPCKSCSKNGEPCMKHNGPEPIDMLIMRAEIGCFHDIMSGRNRVEGKLYEQSDETRVTRAGEQGLLTPLRATTHMQRHSFANRAVGLWNAIIKDCPPKYSKVGLARLTKPVFRQCLKETVFFRRAKWLDMNIYNYSATERRIDTLKKYNVFWFRQNT